MKQVCEGQTNLWMENKDIIPPVVYDTLLEEFKKLSQNIDGPLNLSCLYCNSYILKKLGVLNQELVSRIQCTFMF